jgi:hypothetical protein
MSKIQEFVNVYRMYRRMHGVRYSLARAYTITFRGLPF